MTDFIEFFFRILVRSLELRHLLAGQDHAGLLVADGPDLAESASTDDLQKDEAVLAED